MMASEQTIAMVENIMSRLIEAGCLGPDTDPADATDSYIACLNDAMREVPRSHRVLTESGKVAGPGGPSVTMLK